MVDAKPFRGLRYEPAVAGDPETTSAPSYDALDRFTYASHRAASPYTVLELLGPPDDTGSYRAAGAALRRWRRTGVLISEPAPAVYHYEEHELRRGIPTVQRGLMVAVALEDPGPGSAVLTHEAVDPERVAERVDRLEAVQADLAPVFALTTGAPAELRRRLARPPDRPPVVALTDAEGIDHRVWAITDPEEITALCRALAGVRVLVADGHHRYAAALAARSRHRGDAWRRTLMYVVDATVDGPQVGGVHRLLRGADEALLHQLARDFAVAPAPSDPRALCASLDAAAGRAFGLLLGPPLAAALGTAAAILRPRDEAALARRLPPERSSRWRSLDTAVLDHAVLPRLHAKTVEHRADLDAAAEDTAAADDVVLLLVRPVDPRTAEALAASGEHMPPKSTYFRPKPRAGLVLRPLDE